MFHQKIINGFKLRRIDSEMVKNYSYCGGESGSSKNYFDHHYVQLNAPPHETHCVCGSLIVKNYYIRHRLTDQIIVVGICCVTKFVSGSLHKPYNQLEKCGRCCNLCHTCKSESNNESDASSNDEEEASLIKDNLCDCNSESCQICKPSELIPFKCILM